MENLSFLKVSIIFELYKFIIKLGAFNVLFKYSKLSFIDSILNLNLLWQV